MRQIDNILGVLRSITNSKTDRELTENLEISYSSLDRWKAEDKIPVKKLLEFSQKLGISMDDLIKGNASINLGDNNIAVSGNNNSLNLNELTYSAKFNEFVKLYEKYGNEDLDFLLDPIIEKLKIIKKISNGE